MAPTLHHACDRCGRPVSATGRCPRHPGARLLDLRRPDNAAWQADLLQLRRDRWQRLASFGLVGGAALGGLGLLTLFLFGGLGVRMASQNLGLVAVVVVALHVSFVLGQVGAVGLALLNLGRWLRNALGRRRGGTRRDPLAWRKAPYVAGALLHGVALAAGTTLGQLSLFDPLHQLVLAAVVALVVMGVMLVVDVADLAARQVAQRRARGASPAALPDRSWEAWLAGDLSRVEQRSR